MWWFIHYHVLRYNFELVNVWSKSDDEEDALMKAVGKVVGLTGDSMVWHFCGIPIQYFMATAHRFNPVDDKLPLKFA